jgi:ferric-dicitrate binding protein FerR (iron transport regulator)
MSADRPDTRSAREARAREAVAGLERPRADAAFRERLKRDFVSGRIGERRSLVLEAVRQKSPAWRLAFAVAAALLVVVGVMSMNRGGSWTVLATTGDGVAIVEGQPVPLAHHEALDQKIQPGMRITVPEGGEMELTTTAGLVVQVTAGTEFVLPTVPGRWFGRRATGSVRRGEIRLTTGPAFRGAALHIDTPEAVVVVTGTTLAVICEPTGTCVCVHDGAVKVGPRGGAMEDVTAGRRRYVFNDGRPPETAEIRATEVHPLGTFRDRRKSLLERPGR